MSLSTSVAGPSRLPFISALRPRRAIPLRRNTTLASSTNAEASAADRDGSPEGSADDAPYGASHENVDFFDPALTVGKGRKSKATSGKRLVEFDDWMKSFAREFLYMAKGQKAKWLGERAVRF
jgi:hypothetical protein